MSVIVKIALWIGIIIVAFVIGMYLAQRSMIYFPSSQKPAIGNSTIEGIEEIQVTTEDGLNLFSWYKAPSAGMPTILWFHGNASNVGYTVMRAAPFVQKGYGVLLAEYRGYSSNPGRPTEDGLYQDARAYMNFLLKDKGTLENSIILYGESIGTGPAVQMATEFKNIHTLVLEAPMTNFVDVAAVHYPYLPASLLLKDRYDNLSKIGKISAPLIVIHGERDTVIPYAFGKKLFDAAPEPKSMITITQGDHNDLADFDAANKILSILTE